MISTLASTAIRCKALNPNVWLRALHAGKRSTRARCARMCIYVSTATCGAARATSRRSRSTGRNACVLERIKLPAEKVLSGSGWSLAIGGCEAPEIKIVNAIVTRDKNNLRIIKFVRLQRLLNGALWCVLYRLWLPLFTRHVRSLFALTQSKMIFQLEISVFWNVHYNKKSGVFCFPYMAIPLLAYHDNWWAAASRDTLDNISPDALACHEWKYPPRPCGLYDNI